MDKKKQIRKIQQVKSIKIRMTIFSFSGNTRKNYDLFLKKLKEKM